MNVLPAPVFSAAQVRAMDAYAIERIGIPGYTLMTRAGESALDLLADRWPAASSVLVLCGAGNNAGDGYVLARLARAAQLNVTVAALSPPDKLAGDAAQAYGDFRSAGGSTEVFDPGLFDGAGVVVDALLGTGLDRPVGGAYADCIDKLNACGRPVLALDIPSGLHADSGAVLGVAVEATHTMTFVGLKTGLFLGEAPNHVGRLAFSSLGVADAPVGAPVLTRLGPAQRRAALPPRKPAAHKGDNGRVLIIGGGPGMPGAARLAGESALRVGAGLVTVATLPEHVSIIVSSRPELMCRGVTSGAELEPLLATADVVAVGPGLGQSSWARDLLEASLSAGKRTIVDADGLNLLAAAGHRSGQWVLTPHPGEAARLLGLSTQAVQSDRLGALRALQERYDGVIVLKGAGSLVLGSGGRAWVCDAGNPGMAAAGMGDVLTGTIAGIAGQCADLELSAATGVWVHASAGDAASVTGQRGLLASDVIAALPACINAS